MVRSPCGLVLSVLISGGVIAGCSEPSDDPAAAPVASAAVASTGPADEPPGANVCGKAVRAVADSTLMHPGVVADLAAAAGTADAPVADAARRLSEAYADAVAAHDTADEPDAVAAVSAAAAELVEVCDDSGLETAG